MLSPVIYLMMNGLFFTLRLSGGGGSFPRPLKAAEEKECLERCAQGDLEARNISLWNTICVWWRTLLRRGEAEGGIFPVKNDPAGAAEFQVDF